MDQYPNIYRYSRECVALSNDAQETLHWSTSETVSSCRYYFISCIYFKLLPLSLMIHPPEACTAPWFTQLQGSSRLWHISKKRNLEFNLSRLIYAKTAHLHISSPILSLGISVLCRTKTISTSKLLFFFFFFLVEPKLLPVSLCIKWNISRQPKFDSLGSANNSQAPNSFASKKMENSAIGAEHCKIKRLYFVFFGHKRKNSTYLYYILFPFCFSSWAQVEQPHITSAV